MENQGENSSSCRRLRVVMFPLPFQGHINPMLQLANILYSKGFLITIIHTNFNSRYTSKYPHFTFRPVLDNDSKNNNLSMLSSKGIDDPLSYNLMMINYCIDSFTHCLTKLLENEPVACMISDSVWHFTQSVADSLKLSRIVLRASSMSCIPVYATLPFVSEKGYVKTAIKNEVVVVPMTKKDIDKVYKGGPEDAKLDLISSTIKETKAASGIIVNTFKELEETAFLAIAHDFRMPIFAIGPFHKYFQASSSSLLEQDRSFMSWLDLQPVNSVVYVSFGSIAQMGQAEFSEMAWGLANSKQRFLWVVRPGLVSGSERVESLPDGFGEEVGERGRIVKWAPQQEVLAHKATGAFWTHSGWNSTLESICEGVPMICSPCSFDQPINARCVTDVWKIGVMLDDEMDRDEIGNVIKKLIIDKEGDEMRQRSKALQEKVNISLENGGSANQSLKDLVEYILSF
ncbi:UDP-glycosyltransferase 76G1-like [Rutidosis leptorrhynchoides]|uniref:UDP-glycosyltransferase 76G1-like n=1 Tax=Rutidosis leptorrhynchoides TaxID=125765 RepID=UPI003A99A2D1